MADGALVGAYSPFDYVWCHLYSVSVEQMNVRRFFVGVGPREKRESEGERETDQGGGVRVGGRKEVKYPRLH